MRANTLTHSICTLAPKNVYTICIRVLQIQVQVSRRSVRKARCVSSERFSRSDVHRVDRLPRQRARTALTSPPPTPPASDPWACAHASVLSGKSYHKSEACIYNIRAIATATLECAHAFGGFVTRRRCARYHYSITHHGYDRCVVVLMTVSMIMMMMCMTR